MHILPGLGSILVFASAVLARSVEHAKPFARSGPIAYDSYQASSILPAGDSKLQTIIGIFLVPMIFGDVGSGVKIFVALDGHTCSNVSLRAGIEIQIDEDNSPVYKPFYYWHPDGMHTFENITVSAGNNIAFLVTALDQTSGAVTILTDDGQISNQQIESNTSLCFLDASWNVEPPYNGFGQFFYQLANFGTIFFQNAIAMDDAGQLISPTGNNSRIVENGQHLTSVVVIQNETSVEISYLPGP